MNPQQTPEWFADRCGKITASRISEVLAGGKGLTRAKYMAQLAAERMTGKTHRFAFRSAAIEHGNEFEANARMLYEIKNHTMVEQCGFIDHKTIPRCGCSPDGLVEKDGMTEIKCPDTDTFLDYKLKGIIPTVYQLQMTWQIATTRRKWCDFVAYDPDLPEQDGYLQIRFTPTPKAIKDMEQAVLMFDIEVTVLIKSIIQKRSTT